MGPCKDFKLQHFSILKDILKMAFMGCPDYITLLLLCKFWKISSDLAYPQILGLTFGCYNIHFFFKHFFTRIYKL